MKTYATLVYTDEAFAEYSNEEIIKLLRGTKDHPLVRYIVADSPKHAAMRTASVRLNAMNISELTNPQSLFIKVAVVDEGEVTFWRCPGYVRAEITGATDISEDPLGKNKEKANA